LSEVSFLALDIGRQETDTRSSRRQSLHLRAMTMANGYQFGYPRRFHGLIDTYQDR
jgi:hypothetical protein